MRRRVVTVIGAMLLLGGLLPAAASAQGTDPRVGLDPGYFPWSEASSNIDLLDNDPRVAPFDAAPGNFGFVNSDLAFSGDNAIVGSFNGFQIYDISDQANPVLRSSFVCPGGQGDPSVFGNLLFMSVEETRGRIDCGSAPITDPVTQRFRGVRIFDISDIDNPVQLPGVQTCRGSHTHTLVTDPADPDNIYVYNSGTAGVRSPLELAGCENAALTQAPVTTGNPTQWRIDVIKVPLAAPQTASIVSQPRIFTDPVTGAFNGLQNTLPGALHPSGTAYSPLPNTNTCHDVSAFPEIGLLAGACQGNGILLDISDPVNPVRLDAVSDPNFSYWHSAQFSNDGTKVMFTDEWGGGVSARCRSTDLPEWGADALFDIVDGKMEFASYYKMPAVQTVNENCVAHNSSVIPVPNRDIYVQAWYQGGVSVVDFTDTANPVEIAFFDRGPINSPFPIPDPTNPNRINLGGLWSTYWYNGFIYGTEIARGFDTYGLLANDQLTANEIEAASEVQLDQFNSQLMSELVAAPSFAVVLANLDQVVRADDIDAQTADKVRQAVDKAEKLADKGEVASALDQLNNAVRRL
ncbi:MAG: LVIVD repeat-containing protein, partial [Acidimicrobiales bacterium]